MTKRRRVFEVRLTTTLIVEIDDKVLKRGLSKSFRKRFYTFVTEADVAGHIGYNHVANNAQLHSLDGFADLKDSLVEVIDAEYHETEARELKPIRIPAEATP